MRSRNLTIDRWIDASTVEVFNRRAISALPGLLTNRDLMVISDSTAETISSFAIVPRNSKLREHSVAVALVREGWSAMRDRDGLGMTSNGVREEGRP